MTTTELETMLNAKLKELGIAPVVRALGGLEVRGGRDVPSMTVPYSAAEARAVEMIAAFEVELAKWRAIAARREASRAEEEALSQNRSRARRFGALYNEGGDGYNRYR